MARAVHGDAPMSEARTGGDTSKSKEELERALRAVKEEIKKLRESQGVFPFVCFACQCHSQVLYLTPIVSHAPSQRLALWRLHALLWSRMRSLVGAVKKSHGATAQAQGATATGE
jgi:hypothetical protein